MLVNPERYLRTFLQPGDDVVTKVPCDDLQAGTLGKVTRRVEGMVFVELEGLVQISFNSDELERVYVLNDWVRVDGYGISDEEGQFYAGRCPARANERHAPRWEGEENRMLRTSRIVLTEGRRVWTKSGSPYYLGTPAPDYVAFLKDQGLEVPAW